MGNWGLKMWCGFMSPAARALALHFSSIYRDTDTWKSTCNHAGFPMSKRLRKRKNTFSHLPELYLLIFFHFFHIFPWYQPHRVHHERWLEWRIFVRLWWMQGSFLLNLSLCFCLEKWRDPFLLKNPNVIQPFYLVESGSWLWCSELSMRVLDLVIP